MISEHLPSLYSGSIVSEFYFCSLEGKKTILFHLNYCRQQPVSGVGVINDKCSAQRQRCLYLLITRCFPCTGHHAEGASAAVEAGTSAFEVSRCLGGRHKRAVSPNL